jgi:hypothetical protein
MTFRPVEGAALRVLSLGGGVQSLTLALMAAHGEIEGPPLDAVRACTRDFKIRPVERAIRRLLGLKKGQRVPAGVIVEQWIGISLDEIIRATPSKVPWIVQRWPLLEKRMRRSDCVDWLRDHGYPVPEKKSCWFCPYTANARWAAMKRENGEEWNKACDLDDAIRSGFIGSTQQAFIHRSGKPLREADLEDNSQVILEFADECSGRCGT